MSWDGIIFRAPSEMFVNDLPSDFQMSVLGTTFEIGRVLQNLFPNSQHSHGQCCIEGDGFWLELNFSDTNNDDTRDCIGVRSNAGLGVIPVLESICKAFNSRLFDCQTGEFADLESGTRSSMSAFASWRDRVIDRNSSSPDAS